MSSTLLKNKTLLVKTLIIAVVPILVLASLVVSTTATVTFAKDGVSFEYPRDYKRYPNQNSNPEDTSTSLLNASREKPMSTITVNVAADARKAANALKISQLDYLEDTADKKLKLSYQGYKKQVSERTSLSGYDASVYSFSYIGNDGKTKINVKYTMVIANGKIYYVTVQSVDEKAMRNDYQTIAESLRIQS